MPLKMLASVITAASVALAAIPASTSPAPSISAQACILQEMESGAVLYQKSADLPLPSASTVKILTALVVLEHCELDDPVTIKAEWTGIEGSSAFLRAGETLTVRDLLAGLLLASGNDAAVALASHVSGNIDCFAALMNETARRCGAVSSVFVDPNGLDDVNQRTTAVDLAHITRAAMEKEELRAIVSQKQYSCAGHTFVNHNKLLTMCEGAQGVKTGYTKAAGRALVSLIERESLKLICVTLNAPDDWRDHMALADWAQENFDKYTVCREGEVVAYLPVISGLCDTISVIADRTITKIVPKGHEYNYTTTLPRFVYAPVQVGDTVGRIDCPGDSAALIALDSSSVDPAQSLGKAERIKRELLRLFSGD